MAFMVATLLATALAGTALAVGIATTGSLPGISSESIPLLFIAGCLCIAGLLRNRLRRGAWLATATAAGFAALELVGTVRANESLGAQHGWLQLVEVTEAGLIGASAVAAIYAGKGAALERGWRALGWSAVAVAGFAVVAGFATWILVAAFLGDVAAVTDGTELSGYRISARLALGFVALATVIGLGRDLRKPIREVLSRSGDVTDLPRAIIDQLLPSAAATRRGWQQEERARLAGDLHALVLPDLRRALRTADTYGEVGQALAADLRKALEGVEGLMQGRESVVLEEFGLVAALEWLAERTEHEGLTVSVQLDDAATNAGAFPKPVARSAFRVAMLALDNVVRHAAASNVELRLQTSESELRLIVIDDGRGRPAADRRTNGRGLRDIRAAAADVGGAIDLRSSVEGTTLTFSWLVDPEIAGKHVATPIDSTDGANAAPA